MIESFSPRRGNTMRFQKSELIEPVPTLFSDGNSMGPLANTDESSPAQKVQTHEMHEKAGNILKTCGHGLYGAI
jgi:hypothetical protein